jgi:hypothetical protein
MDNQAKEKLKKALKNYFEEIYEIYTRGDFREESFYPYL